MTDEEFNRRLQELWRQEQPGALTRRSNRPLLSQPIGPIGDLLGLARKLDGITDRLTGIWLVLLPPCALCAFALGALIARILRGG